MTETFEPVLKLEHADSRGEIYSITLPDDQELMLLHSKPGSFRGGHAHDVSEIIVLLTGAMQYHKKMSADSPEEVSLLHGGDVSFNQAGQFHVARFLEDTWLLEWKLHTDKKGWVNIDDPGYRAIVKASI